MNGILQQKATYKNIKLKSIWFLDFLYHLSDLLMRKVLTPYLYVQTWISIYRFYSFYIFSPIHSSFLYTNSFKFKETHKPGLFDYCTSEAKWVSSVGRAVHLYLEEPDDVVWASRMPPCRDFLGTSYGKQASQRTKDTLEGLCLRANP